MSSTSFPVVGLSGSVALAVCAAGIHPIVSGSVATAKRSHAGKLAPLMGGTL
jgi:hypothetical protein